MRASYLAFFRPSLEISDGPPAIGLLLHDDGELDVRRPLATFPGLGGFPCLLLDDFLVGEVFTNCDGGDVDSVGIPLGLLDIYRSGDHVAHSDVAVVSELANFMNDINFILSRGGENECCEVVERGVFCVAVPLDFVFFPALPDGLDFFALTGFWWREGFVSGGGG